MKRKTDHIKCLVHFAQVDREFHEKEIAYIQKIGKRLGLTDDLVMECIREKGMNMPELPESEVLRYILFDDILNLLTIDGVIKPEEATEAKKVAQQLGFDPAMTDQIITKLKKHIELGDQQNEISLSIKNEVYRLSNNIQDHAEYNY